MRATVKRIFDAALLGATDEHVVPNELEFASHQWEVDRGESVTQSEWIESKRRSVRGVTLAAEGRFETCPYEIVRAMW